jgi:1,2-diacylglycerol 3-beta-galactosyltransferase
MNNNPSSLQRVDFIFFDAGGGHRSAANALKAVCEQQKRPWDIRMVNLQDVLDPLDIFRKYTGVRMQDIYNTLLKRGYTIGAGALLKAMHAIIWAYHGAQVRLLSEFWSKSNPNLVVSLIPNFNRAIFDALRTADTRQNRSSTPMVTILTDLADYPPHFWIEKQEQYFICGTEKAREQAGALGHSDRSVFQTSGMILRPKFYEPLNVDRNRERERLGLRADLPTGLVLFGGEGSQWMKGIARRVSESDLKLQLILICGRNQQLREQMQQLKVKFPMFVEGFTSEIPYYMYLSDFFIGKPGPGSISEALAMKLPVIVESNAWTLPQERYNTEWVKEHEVGIVIDSWKNVVEGLRQLLEPARFARFRAQAAALENNAVFEIPEILNRIMQEEVSAVH